MRQLLLHVGLPKTGSTALQRWCYTNRDMLSARGITYPLFKSDQPWLKHQVLVTELLGGSLADTSKIIEEPISRANLLLSAEGLTNHLYDFSEAALADFRALTRRFETRVFVVLRKPASWICSYYKQALINPPLTRYDYATPLDLPSFAALPRIKRLTNTSQLLADVARLYGAASITTAQYEDDWFGCFLDFLGVAPNGLDVSLPEGTNESLPDVFAEVVRQINALGLASTQRAHCLWMIGRSIENGSDVLSSYQPLPQGEPCRTVAEETLRSLLNGSPAEPLFRETRISERT